MQITIYTKSNCPNCVTAKQLLKSKGLEYVEFPADKLTSAELAVVCGPGSRQMPQIWIDDQRVGGLSGLQAALKELGL